MDRYWTCAEEDTEWRCSESTCSFLSTSNWLTVLTRIRPSVLPLSFFVAPFFSAHNCPSYPCRISSFRKPGWLWQLQPSNVKLERHRSSTSLRCTGGLENVSHLSPSNSIIIGPKIILKINRYMKMTECKCEIYLKIQQRSPFRGLIFSFSWSNDFSNPCNPSHCDLYLI